MIFFVLLKNPNMQLLNKAKEEFTQKKLIFGPLDMFSLIYWHQKNIQKKSSFKFLSKFKTFRLY